MKILEAIRKGLIRRTDPVIANIRNWQSNQSVLTHAGGRIESSWGSNANLRLDVTFIDPGYAFRQDGVIRQVTLLCNTSANIPNLITKLKVFRPVSGTTYSFVAEQVFTPPTSQTNGKVTITLNPPIAVQMGDVPGLYWYAPTAISMICAKSLPAWNVQTRYVAGDITAQANFTSQSVNHISMEWFMYPPFLTVTGDSIAEGHNGVTQWHNGLDNIAIMTLPGGEPTSEIANQLRAKIGDGTLLEYQNLALGSQDMNYVAVTGVVNCHAFLPNTILIHAGINDILTDRSWANVDTDLDTIKAAITTERLLIDEILPCTNASDARAANIRTFNANLETWCAANGAILVRCWQKFGQLRAATNYNDNLLTAYSQDGTHLSVAGVDALASIWKTYL